MANSKHNAPNRVAFTRGRVDRFTCPHHKSESFLWDTKTPGLGIRARRGGSRQYIFQSRLHGASLRLNIGPADSWDIDGAQEEARRLRVLVDSGIHPKQEQRQREAAAQADRDEQERARITLGDVWPRYIEARRDDWSEGHLATHQSVMQAPGVKRKRSPKKTKAGPLYGLKDERLAALTPERLVIWLEAEKKRRPTITALAYRLLRACLNWCNEQQKYRSLVDTQLFNGTVRRAVPRPKAKDDVLQREQLALWFDAVRAIDNPVISAYVQALLLTGARRGEMALLRWADIDFNWGGLTLRDKVEGERTIPLTPYLVQLLAALPRRNEYVFSSPSAKSGRLTDANHRHTLTLQAAGLPHVTLHGLRRSFGTLSEWVECPVGVVAQIQGHKPSALAEKHYRRRPLDLLRLWHTRIERWIIEQAGLEQPAGDESRGLRLVKGE